jgi:hypothetical protein
MSRGARFDLAVCACVAALYVANRWLCAFDAVLPARFARYHLNDLLAGVVFPAYVNLFVRAVRGRPLVASILSAAATAAVCSVAWEVVAPAFLARSTADVLDVVCYFCGAFIYLGLYRAVLGRGTVSLW